MYYTTDEVIIEKVETLDSKAINEIVSHWHNPMLMITTNKGEHLAHIHHINDFILNLSNEVSVKRSPLRQSKVNHLDFISIR